jgi:hypothetical protein
MVAAAKNRDDFSSGLGGFLAGLSGGMGGVATLHNIAGQRYEQDARRAMLPVRQAMEEVSARAKALLDTEAINKLQVSDFEQERMMKGPDAPEHRLARRALDFATNGVMSEDWLRDKPLYAIDRTLAGLPPSAKARADTALAGKTGADTQYEQRKIGAGGPEADVANTRAEGTLRRGSAAEKFALADKIRKLIPGELLNALGSAGINLDKVSLRTLKELQGAYGGQGGGGQGGGAQGNGRGVDLTQMGGDEIPGWERAGPRDDKALEQARNEVVGSNNAIDKITQLEKTLGRGKWWADPAIRQEAQQKWADLIATMNNEQGMGRLPRVEELLNKEIGAYDWSLPSIGKELLKLENPEVRLKSLKRGLVRQLMSRNRDRGYKPKGASGGE